MTRVPLIATYWPVILGLMAVLGLLLAFHQVVQDNAQLAASRHAENAARAQAQWRCYASRDNRSCEEAAVSDVAAESVALPMAYR